MKYYSITTTEPASPPTVRHDMKKRTLLPTTVCFYCERILFAGEATVDHFIPTSRKGPDHWWNRVPACQKCNSEKSDRLPTQEEFERWAIQEGITDRLRTVPR